MNEKRKYQRYALGGEVYCEIIAEDGVTYRARIQDLSSTGARLYIEDNRASEDIRKGCAFQIYNYSQGSGYIAENMSAIAVWHAEHSYGIRYASPIVKDIEEIMMAYPHATPV